MGTRQRPLNTPPNLREIIRPFCLAIVTMAVSLALLPRARLLKRLDFRIGLHKRGTVLVRVCPRVGLISLETRTRAQSSSMINSKME